MAKIYTKTGDDGTTAIYGGKRLKKSDAQVKSYGDIDELSSFIGVVLTLDLDDDDKKLLTKIQHKLYHMMAVLCGADVDLDDVDALSKQMEEYIDVVDKTLPQTNKFILPQGTKEAAWLHVVRTVCRRAERSVVSFGHPAITQYVNRLSDLFYVMARKYNKGSEILAGSELK